MDRATASDSRLTRARVALILALCAAVTAALLLPWTPTDAQARRYGRKYNYGAVIARCKGGCRSTAGAISACRNRFVRTRRSQCVQASRAAKASCAGDGACKRSAQSTLRTCVGEAAQQARADRGRTNARGCGRCCQKSRGSGSCRGYMSGSRFYGSSRYRGGLSCTDNQVSSASPDSLGDTADRLRGIALAWLRDLIGRPST